MNEPLITIGVSTYNRKELLKESLNSLLQQDFSDFEIVVVDDGSTDGTKELVQQEFPQVRYFYQANAGDAAAKNHVAREARGRYLVFNDSDDCFYPDALSRLYEPLKNHPDSCSYGQYVHMNLAGETAPAKLKMTEFPSGNILKPLLRHIIVHSCGFMLPTQLFLSSGGFDETLKVGHDYQLTLEIAVDHEFFALQQPVFKRRRHPGNLSGNSYDKIKIILGVVENFATCHPHEAAIYAPDLQLRRQKLHQNLAREARREHRGGSLVREHLKKSLQCGFDFKSWANYYLSYLSRD